MTARVVLKPNREISIKNGHPWIFSGAVREVTGEVAEGDVVEIIAAGGAHLGVGHFYRGGISVKLLSHHKESIDSRFWKLRLQQARDSRQSFQLPNDATNAYRLVNAEGDLLPGLVIDVYDDHAVMQTQTKGMLGAREEIAQALDEVFEGALQTIYWVSHAGDEAGHYLKGSTPRTTIREHDKLFLVDWEKGQKTGFFLDQRENRALLGSLSIGKSVLNTFCFTGGFSIYAAKEGATRVVSVDSSRAAMEVLEENVRLNEITHHESHIVDCFDYFSNTSERFDIVVVDPPAFAKHLKAVPSALRGYERLNALALSKVKHGGLLFTFSCSGAVNREDFRGALMRAGAGAQRTQRVVAQLSQPLCHPTHVAHSEGEYLKGFVMQVWDR